MNTISVIIPCYNHAQFIDETLESVYNQSYADWECIIVNDGSQDNSSEIVKKWLKKDDRYSLIDIENQGVCVARNIGIEQAKGEFILPLDADDIISSDYLELGIKEFKNNRDLKLVYCKAEKFGGQNGLWNLKPFSLNQLAYENMIFCSGLYKKSDWKRVEGYDQNMKHGLEDWDFWISMLKNGGEVKQLDKVCFYYRIKENSRNKNFTKTQEEELYKYMSDKHSKFFISQFGSFHSLHKKNEETIKKYESLTRSKKYVLNLFSKTFFRINFFKE